MLSSVLYSFEKPSQGLQVIIRELNVIYPNFDHHIGVAGIRFSATLVVCDSLGFLCRYISESFKTSKTVFIHCDTFIVHSHSTFGIFHDGVLVALHFEDNRVVWFEFDRSIDGISRLF